MIELELEINGEEFRLNEEENIDKLKQANLKKIGFITRRLLKQKKGEIIYFSKNCFITFFKSLKNQIDKNNYDSDGKLLSEFVFGPSGRNQNYMSGPWGTSAYLYFVNYKLYKISFQTIYNHIMAKQSIIEFEKRMVNIYGKTECFVQNGIRICTWVEGNSKVVTELNESHQHSFIHWVTD